jgi:hypothetical protein
MYALAGSGFHPSCDLRVIGKRHQAICASLSAIATSDTRTVRHTL